MTNTKTVAQEVSELMGNNGLIWQAENGKYLSELCEEHPSLSHIAFDGNTKYVFSDDSCIVVWDHAWDMGLSGSPEDCFCWDGVQGDYPDSGGHSPNCKSLEVG